MSFWKANLINGAGQSQQQIPVEQKSQSVRADQSQEYSAGNVVRIDLPASVGMINPEESYLAFNVKISVPANASAGRLSLDNKIGAHSLIKDLRIFSLGDSQRLLEELTNYNHYVAIKYDYSATDAKKNYLSTQIGSVPFHPNLRQTSFNGVAELENNNYLTNPYYKTDVDASGIRNIANGNGVQFVDCKVQLKLESGLFSTMKALPVNLMQGLRVELTLEDDAKVFRQLDTASPYKVLNQPSGLLVNGTAAGGGDGGIASDYTGTAVYFSLSNNNLDAGHQPFVPGQKVAIFKADGSKISNDLTITSIQNDGTDSIHFIFANALAMTEAATANTAYLADVSALGANFKPSYVVSNVDFFVQTLTTSAKQLQEIERGMQEGGTLVYDFLSIQNYKYSQTSSDLVLNMRVPINNSRCKALLSQPTDATAYSAGQVVSASGTYAIKGDFNSDRPFNGIWDNATDYQLFYEKLQPSRPIDISGVQDYVSAQHIIELEKALDNAEIPAVSFSKWRDNFVIGRAFGLNKNAVYDPRNKDFNVQVNYNSPISKNHLWNNFVVHIRSIEISKNGINVVV